MWANKSVIFVPSGLLPVPAPEINHRPQMLLKYVTKDPKLSSSLHSFFKTNKTPISVSMNTLYYIYE